MTDGLPAKFDVKLAHAFDVRMNFHKRVVFGPVSGGARQGYVSLKDGIVRGPKLNGRIMEYSGADWGVLRQDGVLEANAHYMLEADDGTPIYIHNRGYIYNTQPGAHGPCVLPLHAVFSRAGGQTRLAEPHGHRRRRRATHGSGPHDLPLLLS